MPSPFRVALVAALAIGCHDAIAQTAVPPQVTVQRLAPQLVAFASPAAQAGATIRSPTLTTAAITAPGAGSTPPRLERATPSAPASTATLRH